jgi:hypothetical protein
MAAQPSKGFFGYMSEQMACRQQVILTEIWHLMVQRCHGSGVSAACWRILLVLSHGSGKNEPLFRYKVSQ